MKKMTTMKTITIMEKTKFELVMFARCGLCGKVFCEHNSYLTEDRLCYECQTAIKQNVDCNEEIIDPDLFRNLFTNK